MKVKSESEATQLCPTLSDLLDGSLPGSSVHGIFQARVLEWGAIGQLCPILCDPMDRSLPGSSVHGILQARILEWVAISFSNFVEACFLFPGGSAVKNSPIVQKGEGHGTLLQYPCLENPMDGGAW